MNSERSGLDGPGAVRDSGGRELIREGKRDSAESVAPMKVKEWVGDQVRQTYSQTMTNPGKSQLNH